MYFFLGLCLMTSLVNAFNLIELNTTNVLSLQGEINSALASSFIYDLNKRKNKKGIYVYINSQGGSVESGNQIVLEIQKYKLDCIAERAYSMGFVILQACNKRYIRPYGKLMQHQMSYGVVNEKEKVESYVQFIKQIGDQLTTMQANRIGISAQEFQERTYNDWWIFGGNGVNENCADDIASVKCNTKLTNLTYTIDYAGNSYLFSYCPLINGPVQIKPKSKSSKSTRRYYENSIGDVYL